MKVAEALERATTTAHLHAFITLCADGGEDFAVAVKDVIDVAGVPTTSGTMALPSVIPTVDAPVVAAIRRAAGGIVGKANLHEWAMGLTSINPWFGRVINPRFPHLIAGGSSGGSAAAVAAGLCDWALGTDTGGSIRIPAAACGVVGFKPTFGLLSNQGVVQVSETLDTVGPLAADVAGIRDAMAILTGRPSVALARPNFTLVAPPGEWLGQLDPSVSAMWRSVGATLPVAALPDRAALTHAAWVVLAYEACRFHRKRMEADLTIFSPDVRAVLEAGADLTDAEYESALARLAADATACDAALSDGRVLVIPATASAIPSFRDEASREPLTRFTRPFNGSGQPAICLPIPTRRPPLAMQLVAPRGADAWLLDVAKEVESTWQRSLGLSVQEHIGEA